MVEFEHVNDTKIFAANPFNRAELALRHQDMRIDVLLNDIALMRHCKNCMKER